MRLINFVPIFVLCVLLIFCKSEKEIVPESSVLISKFATTPEEINQSIATSEATPSTATVITPTAESYFNQGVSFDRIHRYNEAIKSFTKSIELNQDISTYYWRGESYKRSGQYQKAIDDFSVYLNENPDTKNANVFNSRGYSYYQLRKYQQALNDFNQAIKLQPSRANNLQELINNARSVLGLSQQAIDLPTFEIINKYPNPKLNCLNKTMDVFIDVFGIWVISTKSAPENYVLHTANVLAQFIDNDSDGVPDDADVLNYLVENNYVFPVWTTRDREDFWKEARGTYCEDNIRMRASMYYDEDEWAIGGINKKGSWDVNLEEVWHVVTAGWSGVYPEYFGLEKPSFLTDAMDVARGGYFEIIPYKYPDQAWYKYYDSSCVYSCQASEYIYWALMANIGALDPKLTDKCQDSSHEWNICTADDLRDKDVMISKLLNDMDFKLPINIPDGSYGIK
ncbi:MAG: tetratricopeptide repeat protein [SAR202 cluster bacterium]|nr:tetratricopeptide repeat protein [SAR202 cluster bacterium]|tara:strand:+ start:7843 stop:9204 length:1362 start_codon:yes stop_codon:yes gene_type:complete